MFYVCLSVYECVSEFVCVFKYMSACMFVCVSVCVCFDFGNLLERKESPSFLGLSSKT